MKMAEFLPLKMYPFTTFALPIIEALVCSDFNAI